MCKIRRDDLFALVLAHVPDRSTTPDVNPFRSMTKPLVPVLVPATRIADGDVRLDHLRRWVSTALGTADFALTCAATDASFRRYFRVAHRGQTWIAVDAPPLRENLTAYLRVADMLSAIGVHVPSVVQREPGAGFLLVGDLGTRTYYDELWDGGNADALYHDALAALLRMQTQGAPHALQLPPYEAAVLQREVVLFTDWFCLRHLQLRLGADELDSLQQIGAWLAQQALAQPRVFVHRDYHSRNLMVCEPRTFPSNPGILDFQDAVQGPLTYDLVSLLRDCYIAWPPQRVAGWLEDFRRELPVCDHAPAIAAEQLHRWFDLMGVQRHLKAIGIFARLWHRDGKPGYLVHIPRTLGYVQAAAARYAALRSLADLIEGRVLPAMAAGAANPDP
jgi:aminoglycoside/choline kinase family phosphotransferase